MSTTITGTALGMKMIRVNPRIGIVIPCFNESENIPKLLDRCKLAVLATDCEFLLVDNGSTDDPLKILKPYIDNGIVVYISLPEKHKQVEHYKKVIIDEDIINKTEWLIICDLDEFFYGYPNKLIDTIHEYKEYDIIYSNWYMFGSDGLIEHPADIRKSIVWRDKNFHKPTKYIVKPNKIKNLNDLDIHTINNMNNKIIVNDKIRLNHYPIQSLDFFTKVKMTRGDVNSPISENVRDMRYFNKYNKNMNYKDTDLSNLL